MSYRLPNLNVEQYRLLPADEQYLLISSIHALYERMLGAPGGAVPMPTPVPQAPAPAFEPTPITAAPITHSNRASPDPNRPRRNQNGGIRSLILAAFANSAGRRIELTTEELFYAVTVTTPYSTHGVRAITHRLLREGVLERVGRAKYRLTHP
jgi:hypothetical protein